MSLRFNAITNITTGAESNVKGSPKISAIFGENVFNHKVARIFKREENFHKMALNTGLGAKKLVLRHRCLCFAVNFKNMSLRFNAITILLLLKPM